MGIYQRALKKSAIKKSMDIEYTSNDTWDDYENAYIETISLMVNSKEDTSMEDNRSTNDGVTYKKYIHGQDENGNDRNWWQIHTIREETLVIQETGKIVQKITYEDMEYWGTATNGKTHYVHRIITENY